jgi:uncharacterized protein YkwD
MIGGIGAYAIGTASSPQPPSAFAGAIPLSDAGSLGTSAAPPSGSAPAHSVAAPAGQAGQAGNAVQSGQAGHVRQQTGAAEYAQAVFRAVNRGRAAQHLPSLVWDVRLQESAHGHNRAMAGSNTLSHQVGAEPALGNRETAVGVRWTYAAENIGWTTERSLAGVLDIEARMLTETAPNDAHRRNILSRQARSIGIDVYFDAVHDRLWLTEDFAGE